MPKRCWPINTAAYPLDTGVCIAAHERRAREPLPRDCARPLFAIERLRKEGSDPLYRCAKQHSEPSTDKRGTQVAEPHRTPLQPIDRGPPSCRRRARTGTATLVCWRRTRRSGLRWWAWQRRRKRCRRGLRKPARAMARACLRWQRFSNALPPRPEPIPLKRIGVDCAAPRHAGRRWGMRATRRWARVSKLSQTGPLTGIGRHDPQPTMRSTNASTGAVAKRRFRLAADRCCVRACPRAILRPKAWPFKWFDKSGNRRWWVL